MFEGAGHGKRKEGNGEMSIRKVKGGRGFVGVRERKKEERVIGGTERVKGEGEERDGRKSN